MQKAPRTEMDEAIDWSASMLGQVKLMSNHSKIHGGHESSICRLLAPTGLCYLKIHQSQSHWHNEVHAYEHWSCAFGEYAPKLLAVRDTAPLALIVSELPGQIMDNTPLLASQERAIWQAAGTALIALHDLGPGEFFGPCLRDGTSTEAFPQDAIEYISTRFKIQIKRAIQAGYINADELSTIRAAYDLIPAFEGERPLPCHRDYCAANWLISKEQTLSGVIDFEFAHWDVRVADFSRDPNWSWIRRPDLMDAFFEGYGRLFTSLEQQQLLVAHAEYAIGAILWGHDNAFYGFEQEGRESLAHLAPLLK